MGIEEQFGCVRISRKRPKIRVQIGGTCGPIGQEDQETLLYLSRVGSSEGEFAAYPPIEVNGQYYTFQFDDLLFDRKGGRYKGRLVVNGEACTTISLQYEENNCHAVIIESFGDNCESSCGCEG